MIDGADTAWILTSTALVLFMTLPGLALFYGGLVRSQNVLSVLMHCFAIACLASVLWLAGVYSLAFGEGSAWIGDFSKFFLLGVARDAAFSGTKIPETVFFMFQMTFAIITPALIVGAFVERIKFGAVMLFSALWLIVVYAPVAHWVWGGGWLANRGVLDFAGGLVVHVTAGVSALVLVLVLGARRGFPREIKPPHAPWMTMAGASMLWVGWFGFNGGSAYAADGLASLALANTLLAPAATTVVWALLDLFRTGKVTAVGLATAIVVGLVAITPAAGVVSPLAALAIGIIGAFPSYFFLIWRGSSRLDDSLDVFGAHGIGGITGALLTGAFVSTAWGGDVNGSLAQIGTQLAAVVIAILFSGVGSLLIAWLVGLITPLRATDSSEAQGLDVPLHGEEAYGDGEGALLIPVSTSKKAAQVAGRPVGGRA